MNYLINSFVISFLALCLTGCFNQDERTFVSNTGTSVKIQTVQYSTDSTQDSYVGVVEESQSIPLSFLTTGTVEKVQVNEGEHVNKGQLLASLNSFSYQNACNLAAAKEKQAQDAFDRLSAVYKNGSLPEVKMVEIETGLEQARSMAQIAQKNMADCNLYAPASGIVGRRSIEPGMNIIPGSAVITLVRIEKVYIKVSIPENEIAAIKPGQKASIVVPALSKEVVTGTIEQKGVMANPLSHTYDIKIAVSNPAEKLKPGMVCNVSISNYAPGNRACIPQSAVQIDNNDRKYVFIADTITGRAVKKIVETGTLNGNGNIIVTKGLKSDDLVIVEGYQKINKNSPIQIIR